MNVSVIIPVLNEYQTLIKLLPALIALNKSTQHTIEVIVSDGGSSDLTCPFVRQCQGEHSSVHLVHSPSGRAKQMNAGALQAKHDCLLFLHADTQLPKQWVDLIADKPWGRFNVRLSGQHVVFRVIEFMMNWRSCLTQVATGDQAIFVERALFYQVGAYPDLPLMEDIALSKKLRAKKRMSCIKTPLVTSSRRWEKHGVWTTMALMWRLRLAYFMGVNPRQLAERYYPQAGLSRGDALVQVFAKKPIEGYVKTRLIPHVGVKGATDIHRYLLQQTLTVVKQSHIKSELWIAQEKQNSPSADNVFGTLTTQAQQGNDLGARMAFAIKKGLQSHQKVVLIGTDCLDLSSSMLQQSIKALNDVDIVFTPVEDGGFITIACRVFDTHLFDDVAWGSDTALADVLHNVKALSLSYQLLKPVRDIDHYDDVINYPELLNLIH